MFRSNEQEIIKEMNPFISALPNEFHSSFYQLLIGNGTRFSSIEVHSREDDLLVYTYSDGIRYQKREGTKKARERPRSHLGLNNAAQTHYGSITNRSHAGGRQRGRPTETDIDRTSLAYSRDRCPDKGW